MVWMVVFHCVESSSVGFWQGWILAGKVCFGESMRGMERCVLVWQER